VGWGGAMSRARLLAAWPLCWLLYGFGDIASRVLNLIDTEWWCQFWYPIYNRSMLASSAIQDWAKGERWFPWNLRAGDYPNDWPDSDGTELP
jgi:hypothetical protein